MMACCKIISSPNIWSYRSPIWKTLLKLAQHQQCVTSTFSVKQVKIRASINKENGVSHEQYLELPKVGMAADDLKARLQSRVRPA